MKRNLRGWKRQAVDHRDFMFTSYAVPRTPIIDLSVIMQFPQLDQGDLGSCGPNSIAEMIYAITKPADMASRLDIYWNTRKLMHSVTTDSGVDNRTMLKALHTLGYVPETEYPYDINKYRDTPPSRIQKEALTYRINAYHVVQQQSQVMRGTIAAKLPFLFGFDVYESMLSDEVAKTGRVPMPSRNETPVGGHDVTIVGYNDQTRLFKFKQHWKNDDGTWWGDNGYGTIPYEYAYNHNLSSDFWVIQVAK